MAAVHSERNLVSLHKDLYLFTLNVKDAQSSVLLEKMYVYHAALHFFLKSRVGRGESENQVWHFIPLRV